MARKTGPLKAAESEDAGAADWNAIARRRMEELGLLPAHVADGSGLDPSMVSRWYRGERELRVSSFRRLCLFLGLTLGVASEGRRGA